MKAGIALMQRVLGEDWYELPAAIRSHYDITEPGKSTTVTGSMAIDYPGWLGPALKLLRLGNALVDMKGGPMAVQVKKWQDKDNSALCWHRDIQAEDGRRRLFPSRMVRHQDHELIEYVGMGFGIRLKVGIEDGRLVYRSSGHLLKLGPIVLPIADCLLLGHALISEEALTEDSFLLHFEIVHPLWGKTYSYDGVFKATAAPD
ncbi:MAG: DUF4166 domain-containing protein [Methylomicrobium sp.]